MTEADDTGLKRLKLILNVDAALLAVCGVVMCFFKPVKGQDILLAGILILLVIYFALLALIPLRCGEVSIKGVGIVKNKNPILFHMLVITFGGMSILMLLALVKVSKEFNF